MDLWIRSQDKEVLVKVNDIAVEMNMIYGYYDKNTEYELLGSYQSKERALEVLDEIENFIYTEVNIVNSSYEAADIEVKSQILCNMAKIFEMPKE